MAPQLETLLDDPVSLVLGSSKKPGLQLPPLQEPIPRLAIGPLPLEPITVANGQAHAKTSKLSSAHGAVSNEPQSDGVMCNPQRDGKANRSVAGKGLLAPTGILTSTARQPTTDVDFLRSEDEVYQEMDVGPTQKRQKLGSSRPTTNAFMQLPRPTHQKTKLAQIPTIAALEELKTQLPNAAHFPPITLLDTRDDEEHSLSALPGGRPEWEANGEAGHALVVREQKRPVKPRKWTEQETGDLLQGVARHGVGNWKKILGDSQFTFDNRSSVDLKDRFRTCFPQVYGTQKMKSSKSSRTNGSNPSKAGPDQFRWSRSRNSSSFVPQNSCSDSSGVIFNGSEMSCVKLANAPCLADGRCTWSDESSSSLAIHQAPQPCTQPDPSAIRGRPRARRIGEEDLMRLGIEGPFPKANRRERRAFSDEEDAQLLKGFTAYGPLWARIRQDSDLNLHSRTAMDLRDRFRNRYPEKYAEAGYKIRPKDWPKPPPRSSQNEERSQQQGVLLLPAPSSSSSSPASPSSSTPPPDGELAMMVRTVEDSREMNGKGPLVQPDEDPAMPSINSLVDWHDDDNTLPPFNTNADGISTGDSDIQRLLLLDHIQPLLTYDPNRSSNLNSSSSTTTSTAAASNNTTKPKQQQQPRPGLVSTTTATEDATTKKQNPNPPGIYLPPPPDFLPLELESSFLPSSSFSLFTLPSIINNPGLSSSTLSSSTTSTTIKPGNTSQAATTTSLATGGALTWEDMATHPMFDIDVGDHHLNKSQ